MVNPLVECVPNFSEGRRPDVIRAIVSAITQAAPVRLLDTSSDTDHNRTVVTFVGSPEAVEQAAFAGIRTAAQLIDLETHRGQHPRIGATDVVPFIPIRDVKMEDCVAIARRLGARVGKELSIPVYLYEAAATRSDRENLENIRRGEYEGLKQAIQTDSNRVPDFGPAELGKAGATVIGARPPLVAFNVYLTTTNVEIAKQIARAIRHSSGGLRYVKALGLEVDGKAQVSMNLTYFDKTPIHRVVEMIRREAQRYGVGIAYSELIGLVPGDALIDSARWYLQLDAFEPNQILERRLEQAEQEPTPASAPTPEPQQPAPPELSTTAGVTVLASGSTVIGRSAPTNSAAGFLEEVAGGTPTPGGGAVSALAGALAAALAEMVARLTIGKKKYADAEAEMNTVVSTAETLRRRLLDAVSRDSRAFKAVMDAYRLDKLNPNRDKAIQQALRVAADVPMEVMRLSLDALRLARRAADRGNVNAACDAAVAGHMALAAIEGAGLNVRVNAASIADADQAAALRNTATSIVEQARSTAAEVFSIAETRAGLR